MKSYLKHTQRLAAETPAIRNRIVDFWRATAIVVVVFGHWLAASIWLTPDGRGHVQLTNSLEWLPFAGWITWVVQVMPIFFFAGGYANARALRTVESGHETSREWITARVRRLYTPVVPLLVVWSVLIVALHPFLAPGIIRAGAMSATLPLWFLAVYLGLIALAPATHAWWRRNGVGSIAVLLGGAIAVDVARFSLGISGAGWLNFVFVWAAVHQTGYLWSDADRRGGVSTQTGWVVAVGSLALLVALTSTGVYPVAMLGIPGAGVTNMTPPTTAMAILGAMQLGVVWATQPAVRRFTASPRGWHFVVSVSGVIMTLYLWHLSAMSLVAAAGLSVFDGTLFRVEPASAMWWFSRPIWLAILTAMTLALTAVFARFEWNINKRPAPRHISTLLVGLVCVVSATAAVALDGIATTDAEVVWHIPAVAIAGAAILGALPQFRSRAESKQRVRGSRQTEDKSFSHSFTLPLWEGRGSEATEGRGTQGAGDPFEGGGQRGKEAAKPIRRSRSSGAR